jgi:hypothetical protein
MFRMILGATLVLAAAGLSDPARAQSLATGPVAPAPTEGQTGGVRIIYGEATTPLHQAILARLKKRHVLEDLQEFLSPLRLPTPLTVETKSCGGLVNAWYSEHRITFCYDLIAYMRQLAPQGTTAEGMTPEDAVVGAFVDIMLHELSHAVFDVLKIPMFGREEDAADALAAFVLLQFGPKVARRTITGATHFWSSLAANHKVDLGDFADGHGLPGQRFYNVLCIAYGAHRPVFQDFVEKGLLPRSRAATCEFEYKQVLYAYQQLIAPHVDPELQKQVREREWLQPDDGKE